MQLSKHFCYVSVIILLLLIAACDVATTPTPFPPTPTATGTPSPSETPWPTWTPQATYTPYPTFTPQPTCLPTPTPILVYGVITARNEFDQSVADLQIQVCMEYNYAVCANIRTSGAGLAWFALTPGGWIVRQEEWPFGMWPLAGNPWYWMASPGGDLWLLFRGTSHPSPTPTGTVTPVIVNILNLPVIIIPDELDTRGWFPNLSRVEGLRCGRTLKFCGDP